MAEGVALSATVTGADGEFYFGVEGLADQVGPFETEKMATDAATDFLTEACSRLVQQALFGDSK
jgi:hypothetical protein